MNGRESLFPALRRDIDRMLDLFGLSQDDACQTHLGDNDLVVGGHDEEPDPAPQRELHDGDAQERDEAPMSRLRPQERDEQGGRRVLPLDAVPLVRLAQRAEGDVAAQEPPPPGWDVNYRIRFRRYYACGNVTWKEAVECSAYLLKIGRRGVRLRQVRRG